MFFRILINVVHTYNDYTRMQYVPCIDGCRVNKMYNIKYNKEVHRKVLVVRTYFAKCKDFL